MAAVLSFYGNECVHVAFFVRIARTGARVRLPFARGRSCVHTCIVCSRVVIVGCGKMIYIILYVCVYTYVRVCVCVCVCVCARARCVSRSVMCVCEHCLRVHTPYRESKP